MPTKYQIRAGNATFECLESGGLVTSASLYLDWAIELPFAHVRSYAKRKGWEIIPVILPQNGNVIVFHGIQYQISWNSQAITSIVATNLETDEEKEITWRDLPETLRNML